MVGSAGCRMSDGIYIYLVFLEKKKCISLYGKVRTDFASIFFEFIWDLRERLKEGSITLGKS